MDENEFWIKTWRNVFFFIISLVFLLNLSLRIYKFQDNQKYSNQIKKYSELEGKSLDFAICLDSTSAYTKVLCVDILRK